MNSTFQYLKTFSPPFLAVILVWINPMHWPQSVIIVIGILIWMLAWWLLETVPMAVTALLPVLLFPLLGVSTMEQACAPYGDKYIFLFLGGFLLALALEKSNLHKRFSLGIVNITGNNAQHIILGFMLASWFISMWISNTATALMMFPIAVAVSNIFDSRREEHSKSVRNFRICLFLGIAYASSIGGLATIIGTPPNAAAVGILNSTFNRQITFLEWMKIGVPFSITLLFLSYWILTNIVFPIKIGRFEKGQEFIQHELQQLGKWKTSEKRMLLIFAIAISLWLSEGVIKSEFPSYPVNDIWVALAAGISLFIVNGNNAQPILEWDDTKQLPWGILLMFGGGLSLAMAFKESGALQLLTNWLSQLNTLNTDIYVITLSGIGLLLTAFMSNLAMVTLFVPVVASLAINKGIDPLIFAIPVTLSASCDFMFPMSTPPNAIAFSSGHIKAAQMFKAGFILNIISFFLLVVLIILF
jgi:sodium-dependent dicarboxylate transporter 2/3/5